MMVDTVTQADRILAADILDEVSDLLCHVGIGQVADLIRDSKYDEHEVVSIIRRHRIAHQPDSARALLDALVLSQSELEAIERTKAVDMQAVRRLIVANRKTITALGGHHEPSGEAE